VRLSDNRSVATRWNYSVNASGTMSVAYDL
jgi:hypothetical protein